MLTKLTPLHVQQLLNEKTKSGLATETVRHIQSTLRCALNDAVRWGLLHRNVASLASPPKLKKKELHVYSVEQISSLLSVVAGERLETVFYVAIYLGLRRGEILGLRWKDVDLDAQTLRVHGTLQRIDKSLQLAEAKTESSRRSLPIPDVLLAKIKTHRAKQLEDKLKAGADWQESGLVFTTKYGTAIEPRNVVRRFHEILTDAKLPKIRFHDLRHSCATLLLRSGVSIRTIMDILGHTKISQTMDIYAHVLPETKKEALNVMGELLSKTN